MEIGTIELKGEKEIAAAHQAAMNCFDWLGFDQSTRANLVEVINELSQIGAQFFKEGKLVFELTRNEGHTGLVIKGLYNKPNADQATLPDGRIPLLDSSKWTESIDKLIDEVKIDTSNVKKPEISAVKWLERKSAFSKELIGKIKNDFALFPGLSTTEALSRLNSEVIDSWNEVREKNKQLEKALRQIQALKEGKSASKRRLKEEVSLRIFSETALAGRSKALEAIYSLSVSHNADLQEICDRITIELADLFSAPFVSISAEDGVDQSFFSQFSDGECSHANLLSLKTLPKDMQNQNSVQFTGNLNRQLSVPDSFAVLPYKAALCHRIMDTEGKGVGSIYVLDKKKRIFEEFHLYVLETFAHYIKSEINRLRMEKQLVNSKEMELLGKITSGVAHEVRNPLNAIMAVSQALFRKLGRDRELKPFMNHINNQIKRLSSIMGDLLHLGKPLRKENLSLVSAPDLVAGSLKAWKASTGFARHTVRPDVRGLTNKDRINVDLPKIQQVFINLLENACSHSPESEPLRIRAFKSDEKSAVIRIIDRGCGMNDDILPSFFEPFFSTRKEGTGLGTSIVRRTIERHGGAVQVYNNTPRPGLTVEFRLPLAP
ncbi:ATP-binding protein [Fibrobacterota bacterium]